MLDKTNSCTSVHTHRPYTSRRQRRRLPPCPLVSALVPLKWYSRHLQFPHRVPFPKKNVPWCPCHFNNYMHTDLYTCRKIKKCEVHIPLSIRTTTTHCHQIWSRTIMFNFNSQQNVHVHDSTLQNHCSVQSSMMFFPWKKSRNIYRVLELTSSTCTCTCGVTAQWTFQVLLINQIWIIQGQSSRKTDLSTHVGRILIVIIIILKSYIYIKRMYLPNKVLKVPSITKFPER